MVRPCPQLRAHDVPLLAARLQGREKDYIILSCVRSNEHQVGREPPTVGFTPPCRHLHLQCSPPLLPLPPAACPLPCSAISACAALPSPISLPLCPPHPLCTHSHNLHTHPLDRVSQHSPL
jgi:hypothetical protein